MARKSDEELREAQCGKKVRYRSRRSADRALKDMKKKGKIKGKMDRYRCPWCGLWHLGHRPGWAGRSA